MFSVFDSLFYTLSNELLHVNSGEYLVCKRTRRLYSNISKMLYTAFYTIEIDRTVEFYCGIGFLRSCYMCGPSLVSIDRAARGHPSLAM